ncbi:putative GTP-binding protein 6 [Pomacea canaliculata]|nr:putative GTP-binding protein 6 [Pomacea canaliculata]
MYSLSVFGVLKRIGLSYCRLSTLHQYRNTNQRTSCVLHKQDRKGLFFDRVVKEFHGAWTGIFSHCIHTGDWKGGETEDKQDDLDVNNNEYQFLREICAIPNAGHHVMVIQPVVKGPKDKRASPELKLSETCALVSTLPTWRVIKQKVVPAKSLDSLQLFGSGNFAQLQAEIRNSSDISAVVLGIDILKGTQVLELTNAWKVPIFDRYTIVLQIFKEHARTKEAKLQVALAEIPYIRSRLSQFQEGSCDSQLIGAEKVGGTGETYMARRKFLLQEQEVKLQKALQQVRNQRSVLRQNRQRSQMPTVAVVGYTNAGKTSLIKAITGDKSLEPKDQLFATLDITSHAGKLPNQMTAIFIDTVGFISDIPVTLIDAFSATLEDALLADVVVHVRDISHPDTEAQKVSVLQTLRQLLSNQQLTSMIEVCNKADRLKDGAKVTIPERAVLTSLTSGQGVGELQELIQKALLETSRHVEKRFRIPMQGPMLAWLYKEATVSSVEVEESDPEHLLVDVVISIPAYERFRARFGGKNRNQS